VISTKSNSVLTGIRFRLHKDTLYLEVRLTDYNTETNTLVPESSIWINNLDEPEVKEVLTYSDDDSPLETPIPSVPDSDLGHTVQFGSASLKKTAGQEVVPYFDGQDVHPLSLRFPLSGIGIFHKGQPGHGGFIAFRLLVLRNH
jgi:hypothetical protein